MLVYPFVAKTYYAQVPGAQDDSGQGTQWTVPCGAQLPDLTLKIEGASVVISGDKLQSGEATSDPSSEFQPPYFLSLVLHPP